MLNKELLMIQAELSQVHVTLQFFGGRNSETVYTWTSPDGTVKTGGVFDERMDVVETLTCKPNTTVAISTGSYSGDYTATPPQDITVIDGSQTYLTFTAFRDVTYLSEC